MVQLPRQNHERKHALIASSRRAVNYYFQAIVLFAVTSETTVVNTHRESLSEPVPAIMPDLLDVIILLCTDEGMIIEN